MAPIVLGGHRKGPPPWQWVAAYVLACQRHGHNKAGLLPCDPGPTTLPTWNTRLRATDRPGSQAPPGPPAGPVPLAAPVPAVQAATPAISAPAIRATDIEAGPGHAAGDGLSSSPYVPLSQADGEALLELLTRHAPPSDHDTREQDDETESLTRSRYGHCWDRTALNCSRTPNTTRPTPSAGSGSITANRGAAG